MILRLNGLRRPAVALALAGAALVSVDVRPLGAHDIPQRVALLAFVKPEPSRLRIVLRAPLEAMRDVEWPSRTLGYLDLAKAMPLARDAAKLWIADYIEVRENGRTLDAPTLVAVRREIGRASCRERV